MDSLSTTTSPVAGAPPTALVEHAFSCAPVVYYSGTWSRGLHLAYLSRNAVTVLDCDASILLATGALEAWVHPEDRAGYRRALQAMDSDGAVRQTYRLVDAHGGYRWVRDEARLAPPGEDDTPIVLGCLFPLPATPGDEDGIGSRLHPDALENLPSGYSLISADGRVLSCNRAHAELLGCTVSEVLALTEHERFEIFAQRVKSIDGFRIDDGNAFRARWIALLAEADSQSHELEMNNGEWKLVRIAHVGGARVVTHTDITRLKNAEAERERLHRLLVDALESIPNGFAIIDSQGRLTLCNSTFSRPYGLNPEEMVGIDGLQRGRILLGAIERIDGHTVTGNSEDMARFMQLGENLKPRELELRSGELMLVTVSPMSDGGYAIIRTDITELKRAEKERERLHRLLTEALESVPNAFSISDSEGELLLCNAAYAELYAVPPAAMTGLSRLKRARRFLRLVESIDGRKMSASEADARWWTERLSRVQEMPAEVKLRSGQWKLVTGSPMNDGGMAVTRTDITSLKLAEEERERMSRLLGEALESIPNDFAIIRADGHLALCNSAYAEIYDRSPEDLLATDRVQRSEAFLREVVSIDGVSVEANPVFASRWRDRLWKGAPAEVEFRNGQWKLVSGSRLSDGGLAIIRTDITKLKTAQHTLRESEARYRALVHHAPIVICEIDQGGAVRAVNAKGVEISPYRSESRIIGRHVRELVRREDHERVACMLEQALGGAAVEFEHVVGRDSDARILSTSFVPIRGDSGVVERVVGIANDITAIREREEALRESEELVRRVLEGCPVPVRMSRLEDGWVLYENRATIELHGEAQAERSPWASRFYADPADDQRFAETLRAQGRVDDFEVELCCNGGRCFPAKLSARLIEYRGEQVAVVTTEDLTEQIALHQEMSRQREAMHQSEKLSALGELLASVAHELNNPLSVVVGQALLLKETSDDPSIAGRAGKIGDAADRCSRIVRTFLAMARQQPGEPVALDVNEVVAASLEVTSYGLRTSDVDVSLRLAPTLPLVLGDTSQLAQVMTNLIVNAQHALQEVDGGRRLEIESSYDVRSRDVTIEVTDNGPGVPPAIRSRIFEPLFTTKKIGAGTGIGLAMCHRIVEGHGGTLCLEDAPHGGAKFTVRLPASNVIPATPGPVNESHDHGPPLEVLVIDDEPDVAEMLADVVRSDGHRVETVHSGERALVRLVERSFDVILSDLRMPGLDGPQLWQSVREQRPDLGSRLVFVTGDSMSASVEAFLESCGRPHLEKPVRPDEVRQIVQEVGQVTRSRRGAS